MSDLWIEDWHGYREARAILDWAILMSTKAGMSESEIIDYVTSQLEEKGKTG